MTIKKIGIFIATLSVIIALVIGCGSSSTNTNVNNSTGVENNNTEVGLESEGFTGSAFKFVLEGLADGMLHNIGDDIMGHFLSLLGWGDSGNSEEEQTLKDIDSTLHEISDELVTIESELKTILTDIKVSEDSIKNDVDWPRDAVNNIDTATQALQELGVDVNGSKIKPGGGNHTKIANLASDILGVMYDIPRQVIAIYNAIKGTPTPLLSNYVNQVMLQLPINDSDNLKKAYQGFEYYTSELLNHQIQGVNLVIEAYHGQDNNSSAQKYLNCYDSDIYNTSECNILYKEIADMDNHTSFIYNAVSMVLRDAPLLYDLFLPTSAESIFKRAEFYRLLMSGTDDKQFGLRIYHISTADMEQSPDQIFVSDDGSKVYSCLSSRHTVKGRTYDFWKDNAFKPSEDYNIVEYGCAGVPNGSYKIYASDDLSKESIGAADVAQYDTNYDLNSSGSISYGFGLVTDRIPDHFLIDSDKWKVGAPSAQNYNSGYNVYFPNSWSIITKANHHHDDTAESMALVNLIGIFSYYGTEERAVSVDYSVQFYVEARAAMNRGVNYIGGNAYAYYSVGVFDMTDQRLVLYGTNHRLHAGPGHDYSGNNDVVNTMSFNATPNHKYNIFIVVESKACCDSHTHANSNLNKVNYIHFRF